MTQQVGRDRWNMSGSAPEIYQKYLVPAVFGPWAPVLVNLASPRVGDRVLDVACGTGLVARHAAGLVGRTGKVVGLDISNGMLSVARSVRVSGGAEIEWREGDATTLPFPDSSFDIVACQLGLQFFPDREKATREMRRVLVPKGRLAVLTWRPISYSPGYHALANALERHAGPEAGKWMRTPFRLGDAQELRDLVQAAGLENIAIRIGIGTVRFPSTEDFVKLYVAGTPLSSLVANMSEKANAAMIQDVAAELASYLDDDGLTFPIEGNLVAATAP